MRSSRPAPSRLVVDGSAQFGTYRSLVAEPNLLDADLAPGWPLPRWVKSLRLKQWQAAQVVTERCVVSLALFDTRIIGLVQIKVFDRGTGERFVFERKVPPWKLGLAQGLGDSVACYEAPGCFLAFRNELDKGQLGVSFRAEPKGRPAMTGELVASLAGIEPLVVSIPFGKNRGMYSTKAHLPVEGRLAWQGADVTVDPASSWLLLDDHKGYYPYVMMWDWAVGAGVDPSGRRVSFNLTHNQALDPDEHNENAIWVDGKMTLLPAVTFERRAGPPEWWHVRDAGGEVDVRFEVVADHRVDVNALVLRSRYRGPVGRFEGAIARAGEDPVNVEGLFGMGERFYLRC